MRPTKPDISFEEYENHETFLEKYKRRIVENPFLTGGLVGLVGMLVVGASKYRKLRADGMSTSIFLINLRVAAQGMVAGCLTLGFLASFLQESVGESSTQKPKTS